MPGKSIRVEMPDGNRMFVTTARARRMLKDREACLLSKVPFVLRLRKHAVEQYVRDQKDGESKGTSLRWRWTACSDGFAMMGGPLMDAAIEVNETRAR